MENNPKVKTIEQFKVLQFIRKHFDMNYLTLVYLDRYTVKVTDKSGDTMSFKWNSEKNEIEVI